MAYSLSTDTASRAHQPSRWCRLRSLSVRVVLGVAFSEAHHTAARFRAEGGPSLFFLVLPLFFYVSVFLGDKRMV